MSEKTKWEKSIFNRDFYPTPEHVLQMMQLNVATETILEPSAGNGNIIEYCKQHGASEVLFCEINKDLAEICKSKARFIEHDFLKVRPEQISHITQIIMNPPFSKAMEHIIHAWDIAPDGCEITSLCNSEMLRNYRYDKTELSAAIEMYGSTFDLGQCFDDAERQTNVEITCIKLFKPISSDNTGFEGFYMDAEPQTDGEDAVMRYDEVQALVNSYIGAVKCFDDFKVINERMKTLCAPVGMDNGFSYHVDYNKQVVSKEDFAKELQKKSWRFIFSKMKLSKYLTSGVMKDIDRFVEQQTKVPFTVKNVYRMFEIIVGTKENSFNRALVEAVDAFTKHTHENRFCVEGWKTNSGHMLNKKFIVDWVFECKDYGNYNGKLDTRYSSNLNRLDDLTKVLCNITGFDFYKTTSVTEMCRQFHGFQPGQWYLNGFFSFKGFKKGTIHLKFEDDKIWEQLNRAYAKIKGEVLPEATWGSKKEAEPEAPEPSHDITPEAFQLSAPIEQGDQIPLFEF